MLFLATTTVAAAAVGICEAFVPQQQRSSPPFSTTERHQQQQRLYFQNPVDPEFTYLVSSGARPTTMTGEALHYFTDSASESSRNLQELHDVMKDSLFTEAEILKLSYAIEEASVLSSFSLSELRNLQARTADYLRILVGTTELGLQSLIAATFHYCATHGGNSDDNALSNDQRRALKSFGGSAAVKIARGAAKLEKLELVASTGFNKATPYAFGLPRQQEPLRTAKSRFDDGEARNLRSLLLMETGDWRGLVLRCAACLMRLRSANMPREIAVRYGREALFLYAPLAARLGMHRLKNELEGSAFKLLYKRQHERVTSSDSLSNSTMTNMMETLHQVQADMKTRLGEDEEFSSLVDRFTVSARVKEPYSLWRKMLRNNYTSFLQVPDALALRVVLDAKKLSPDEPASVTRARERALCYYAQKVCMQHWKPLEGNPRFKDYIKNQKANGYMSLHYTASTHVRDEDWTLEIQVRSGSMHRIAEFGPASHWDYKDSQQQGKKQAAATKQERSGWSPSDAYLRKVQEWDFRQRGAAASMQQIHLAPAITEDEESTVSASDVASLSAFLEGKLRTERIRARTKRLEPYIQALSAAQSDLARDFVFVFLTEKIPSEGKVVALPSGACVIDALREGEKTLGCPLSADELVLNGEEASFTRRLRNGDVLTLPHVAPQQEQALSM